MTHTRCISNNNKKINPEGYTSDSTVQSRQSQVFIINATSPRSAAKMGLSGWVLVKPRLRVSQRTLRELESSGTRMKSCRDFHQSEVGGVEICSQWLSQQRMYEVWTLQRENCSIILSVCVYIVHLKRCFWAHAQIPVTAADEINIFFLTQQLQQLPATSVRRGRLFLTLHNKSSDTAQPFTD